MNKLKMILKLWLVSGCLIFSNATLAEQPSAQQVAQELAKELGLTTEQTEQLAQINQTFRDQLAEQLPTVGESRRAKFKLVKQLKADKDEQLQELFTEQEYSD